MKKFYLIFLTILLLPLASASITLDNKDLSPGETLVAKVSEPNFILTNLLIVDNDSNDIGLGFQRLKLSKNDYLVFLDLPTSLSPGKYSLKYKKLDSDEVVDFSITASNQSLRVDPVYILYDKTKSTFKILVTNVGSETINAEISSTNQALVPVRSSISIPPGESRNVYVNQGNLENDAKVIVSYDNKKFNINVIKNLEVEELVEEKETEEKKARLNGIELLDSRPIFHTITQKQTIEGPIEFKNKLTIPIYNVSFHLTPELANIVDLKQTKFRLVPPNQIVTQFIWINKNKNARSGTYSGTLLIQSPEGDKATLDITVNIVEDKPLIINETKEEPVEETIESINITEENEGISYEPVNISNDSSLGGIILTDGTQEEKEPNRMIGVILIIIILIIAGILIWMLRPKPRKLELKDYIKPLKKR